jgi:hypothetical protein
MQKIQSYLYPNRIQLLADLAGFNVEYTNVYQRTVKIYQNVDNVLEFDIKNADEKRLDLVTSPAITDIELNIMDASGNVVGNSPYTVTPGSLKGIGTVVIPAADLAGLEQQFLKYSVTALKDTNRIPLYGDSRFGMAGTIELITNAMPVTRQPAVYKDFTAEIDLKGNPIWHSSAIPAKFYEAVKTENLSFTIHVTNFIGNVWLEATENDTINVEAWRKSARPFGTWVNTSTPYTGDIPFAATVPVGNYSYFRVSYDTPTMNGMAATFEVTKNSGNYSVRIHTGGTGYGYHSIIRVLGSQLGGVDGLNDLVIQVEGLEGGASSYAVSAITTVSWTGTASDGEGFFIVSGQNNAGLVDSVEVS